MSTQTLPGALFAPTFEQAEMGKRGGFPATSPQGAIQTLNYRLPRVAGAATANALSPLVTDERRGGFSSAVLESVLRTVLGPGDAGALMAGSPASQQAQGGPVSLGSQDYGSQILQMLSQGVPSAAPRQEQPQQPGQQGPSPVPPQIPQPPPPERFAAPTFNDSLNLSKGLYGLDRRTASQDTTYGAFLPSGPSPSQSARVGQSGGVGSAPNPNVLPGYHDRPDLFGGDGGF